MNVVASDYVTDWHLKRPKPAPIPAFGLFESGEKEIAHLSFGRLARKTEADRNGRFGISRRQLSM